jgi:hypothetical protein
MNKAELFRAMGDPTKIEADWYYTFGKLRVGVDNKTGRVVTINTTDPQFATNEKVHVGDSVLAMEAKIGTPQSREDRSPFFLYRYKTKGIEFVALNGQITDIMVLRPK